MRKTVEQTPELRRALHRPPVGVILRRRVGDEQEFDFRAFQEAAKTGWKGTHDGPVAREVDRPHVVEMNEDPRTAGEQAGEGGHRPRHVVPGMDDPRALTDDDLVGLPDPPPQAQRQKGGRIARRPGEREDFDVLGPRAAIRQVEGRGLTRFESEKGQAHPGERPGRGDRPIAPRENALHPAAGKRRPEHEQGVGRLVGLALGQHLVHQLVEGDLGRSRTRIEVTNRRASPADAPPRQGLRRRRRRRTPWRRGPGACRRRPGASPARRPAGPARRGPSDPSGPPVRPPRAERRRDRDHPPAGSRRPRADNARPPRRSPSPDESGLSHRGPSFAVAVIWRSRRTARRKSSGRVSLAVRLKQRNT